MKAVFDTNILIDFLLGIKKAKLEFDRYENKYISIMTYIEVLAGATDADDEKNLKNFLQNFRLIPLNRNVANKVVAARQSLKLKIPDAVIWASAQSEEALLVTRDTKDFPDDDPMVRVPYSLG